MELLLRELRDGLRRIAPGQQRQQRSPVLFELRRVGLDHHAVDQVASHRQGPAAVQSLTRIRQDRHAPVGVSRSSWQSVGTRIPICWRAARIDVPVGHSCGWPLMTTESIWMS